MKGSAKMKPAIQEPLHDQLDAAQSPSETLPRCSYHSPRGRHCNARVSYPGGRLCPRHTKSKSYCPDPELAAELLGPITEFQSASDVTDFLSRLLILQAQDRISPRRAAVMAYTCNLLLRGLRAMDLEAIAAQAAEDAPGQQVVWELTRPTPDPVSDSTGAPIKPS